MDWVYLRLVFFVIKIHIRHDFNISSIHGHFGIFVTSTVEVFF